MRGPRQPITTYRHPVVGRLTLDVQQLSVATAPDQLLVAYTARPDSPSYDALRFLLQWSGRVGDGAPQGGPGRQVQGAPGPAVAVATAESGQ